MIDKLTDEQIALFPKYVEKWKAIGLSTKRINKKRATEAINLLYTCAGLKPPSKILFFKSPHAICEKIRETSKESISWCYGYSDSSWLSFYDVFIENFPEIKDLIIESVKGLVACAKECGWYVPYEDVCYVSDRACKISLEDNKNLNGLLHCETGPSIEYTDGNCLYSLHGVNVPDWVVNTPAEKITALQFVNEKNTEIKRELLRKMGVERLIEIMEAKVIDTSNKDGLEYALMELDLSKHFPAANDESVKILKSARYLKMKNPSIGVWHMEAVSPNCNTVQAAINDRCPFGIESGDWNPEVLT